ncbi:hypothetical protein Ade02nite_75780 [Paractinoplanes deccanensis]|uniref:Uncharacterized protein n=1 Tax=Paractinoplanes deccanensis TaxID=113561 RepID=A0ABQ3YG09_9ACTN|nr:hypothetical protein Ade02nite_75780 [Actinoplanes deccanensis]
MARRRLTNSPEKVHSLYDYARHTALVTICEGDRPASPECERVSLMYATTAFSPAEPAQLVTHNGAADQRTVPRSRGSARQQVVSGEPVEELEVAELRAA